MYPPSPRKSGQGPQPAPAVCLSPATSEPTAPDPQLRARTDLGGWAENPFPQNHRRKRVPFGPGVSLATCSRAARSGPVLSCPVLSVTAASPAPSLEASSPPQSRSAQILPPKNSHFWRVTGLGFQPNPPCAFSGQLLFPGCLLIIKAASQPEATAKILATCMPLLIGFSCTR